MATSGKTVAQIVSHEGWPRFRQLEKEVLKKICDDKEQVVATGGGVVLDPENTDCMKQNGIIVWLQAGSDAIYARMRQDQNTGDLRPALTNHGLMEEIKHTLQERIPLYKNAGTVVVDTEEKKIEAICREVLRIVT